MHVRSSTGKFVHACQTSLPGVETTIICCDAFLARANSASRPSARTAAASSTVARTAAASSTVARTAAASSTTVARTAATSRQKLSILKHRPPSGSS
eukprot:3541343-Prymnesium_polylepis.2